jgi:hypothetical protein
MKVQGENEISRNEQEIIKKNHEKLIKEEQEREKTESEKNSLSKENQVQDNRLATNRAKEAERIQKEVEEASKRRRKRQNEKKITVAGRGSDVFTQIIGVAEQTIYAIKDSVKNIRKMVKEQKLMSKEKNIKRESVAPKLSSKADCEKSIRNHDILKVKVEQLDKINEVLFECKDKHLTKNLNISKKNIEEYIERNYGVSKDKPKFLQGKGRAQNQEDEYRGLLNSKLTELDKFKDQASVKLNEYHPKKDYKTFENQIKEKVQEQLQERTQVQGRER